MKTNFFLLIIFFFTALIRTFSQNENQSVCFTYDQNGNRIKREICNIDVVKADSSDTTLKKISEKFLNFKLDTAFSTSVSVFPNPTDGRLNIVFKGNPPAECTEILLYSIYGQEMIRDKFCNREKSYYLGYLAPGTYILVIKSGERGAKWKVILDQE